MTRLLAELLGAHEPAFHLSVQQLERASGLAGADIRLTTDIERATRLKLAALGLNPADTTGEELYQALGQRVRADDAKLVARLTAKFGEAPVHTLAAQALADLPIAKQIFGLKPAMVRRLLQKLPPRQTMRLLGYRSLDSLLRREPLLAVIAAAWTVESRTWHKAMLDEYKKTTPTDFEIRALTILAPDSAKWQRLAEAVVAEKKHNVVSLPEYGAIVMLPLPAERPPAVALTMLLVALDNLNEIKASSTYLKLSQVRPDFGVCVQSVVAGNASLPAMLLDGPVPWAVVQRYYARFGDRYREELFAPHVQKEDLAWHSIEKAIAYLEPKLAFWQQTATLGIAAGRKPVSLNIIDAALNYCNQLSYEDRLVRYFQRSLWSELMMRYLKQASVEQAVMSSLEMKLAAATGPTEAEFETV